MVVASYAEIFIREKEIHDYTLKLRLRFCSYCGLVVYKTLFSGKVLPAFNP